MEPIRRAVIHIGTSSVKGKMACKYGGSLHEYRDAAKTPTSSAPKVESGFHIACADLKPSKRFVVYPGTERFPLNADTDAIGLGDLGRALFQ